MACTKSIVFCQHWNASGTPIPLFSELERGTERYRNFGIGTRNGTPQKFWNWNGNWNAEFCGTTHALHKINAVHFGVNLFIFEFENERAFVGSERESTPMNANEAFC